MKIGFLLLTCLALASSSAAQLISDTLVADINSAPFTVGSYNGAFASDGDNVFFSAVDQASGESYRVWRTDGTPGGTLQLTTLAVNIHEAAFADDGELYMIADELGIGVTLWKSDGTAMGTVEVLPPQDWTVDPYDLTIFDGAVWFLAGTAATGVELWKSDPVAGTTALAFEWAAGAASGAGDLFASATHLFLSPPGATTLLAGDGTLASFSTVANFSFPGTGTFDKVARVGDLVVFNVAGFNATAGWWSSDGTVANTKRIHESFNDFWAVGAASKVYFTAGEASVPRLWETDGSVAGTLPVDDATSVGGQMVSFQYPGLALGDEFFFGGFVDGGGFEPARTLGAASGSQLVFDVNDGGASSDPSDFVSFDGDVYFRANDGVNGREIWKLDLATGIAQLVDDLTPGPFAGIVGSYNTIAPAQHGVVYGQNFPGFGIEPGVTDGVQAGLLLNIANDGSSAGSGPSGFVRLGDDVLFQAADELTGLELWASDGTAAGTRLVKDIDPSPAGSLGSFGSAPRHLTRFGDRVVFFAGTPTTGNELWITDGTTAGTTLLADIEPGPGSSEPLFSAPPVVLGDTLFAILREHGGAFALFSSDGTAAGTSKVLTTDPSGLLAEFVILKVVNDRLVFNANLGTGLELWSSDGTAAGTELLVDATPGGDSFFVTVFTGDTVAYFSTVVGNVHTIWSTDGTAAGTAAIFVQAGVPFFGGPQVRGVFGDSVLFTVADPAFGIEPWISDGTPGGAVMLADIAPGSASSTTAGFITSGDQLYFAVESPPGTSHFQKLWVSDGTSAGTQQVIELASPVAGAGLGDFWAPGDNGELVFTNVDSNGEEWWITDGSAVGTRPVTDIAPGAAFAKPRPGALLGNTLMFMADDGDSGLELHGVPFAVTDSYAATSIGEGCVGANGKLTLALDSGSPVVAQSFVLSVSSALPGAAVFWAFDFGFGAHGPAGSCTVQLSLPTILTSTVADGSGVALLPMAVPGSAALTGLVVDFQAFASEPGGPFQGAGALTNVLEIVVGS